MAKDKLWFEGKKTHTIIFTEEDLTTVLKAIESRCAGTFAENKNEFDVVKTRILIQMRN